MSRPVIAVIGATGAQGGGLAQAILNDPANRFALRALTRKADGAAARALAAAGAEVAAADLDDESTLVHAFAGAHAVFAVTNFWEHFSPGREVEQAGNAARAAKRAAVKHVIWSTLEDTRQFVPLPDARLPTLGGKYKVPHYDGKGEADALFAGLPVTYLRTSFYWDNLIHFGMGPRRDANGRLLFVLPMGDAKLPGIAAADIGPAALALFAQGRGAIGKTVGIAGEHLSGGGIAAELSRALGESVTHHDMSPAEYAKLGFPGADDLANMFEFKRLFEAEYRASRPVEETRKLYPGLQNFRTWLERNVQRLPVAA
jgi:uncharacterized protein YbjT (DUF2867 family)